MQKIGRSQKIKELRLRPNIASNDLNTKIRQIHNFLMRGHKVRIGVFFKGRENEYTKSGIDIINRIVAATIAIGNEVYKVFVEAESCNSLVNGEPVNLARDIDG